MAFWIRRLLPPMLAEELCVHLYAATFVCFLGRYFRKYRSRVQHFRVQNTSPGSSDSRMPVFITCQQHIIILWTRNENEKHITNCPTAVRYPLDTWRRTPRTACDTQKEGWKEGRKARKYIMSISERYCQCHVI